MATVNAIRFDKTGGPEVLKYQTVDLTDPQANEITVRNKAIGLNYIDTYHRSGLYPVALPSGIGLEGAGIVESIGSGVTDLKIGDRVAYGTAPIGAYAEGVNIPASVAVKLPDEISFEHAAAMMLQGMTAHYLIRRIHRVQAKDHILIHAAAGGVGLIVCQWAKALGATVIGTVGSQEKADLAQSNGCDYPILYRDVDFQEKVREITDGKGVPVVYDSVGADTLLKSLDCLSMMGTLVSFGNASGPPPAIDISMLGPKGSLFVTRPTLFHYVANREDLLVAANELFAVIARGDVKIEIHQTYPLADAKQAHADLEARNTTGSTILIP